MHRVHHFGVIILITIRFKVVFCDQRSINALVFADAIKNQLRSTTMVGVVHVIFGSTGSYLTQFLDLRTFLKKSSIDMKPIFFRMNFGIIEVST